MFCKKLRDSFLKKKKKKKKKSCSRCCCTIQPRCLFIFSAVSRQMFAVIKIEKNSETLMTRKQIMLVKLRNMRFEFQILKYYSPYIHRWLS